MADRYVPSLAATLKFDEEGNLLATDPNGSGGGGGSTSTTTVIDDVDISSGDPTLLVAANEDRKGFIISSSSLGFWIMFGGVDVSGDPIATGQPGAITAEHNTLYLQGGGNYESGSCVWKGAIVALAQTAGDAVHTVKITEFI